MSTVAQVITRAQRQLLSGVVEERNKLAANITATAATASCHTTWVPSAPGQLSKLTLNKCMCGKLPSPQKR